MSFCTQGDSQPGTRSNSYTEQDERARYGRRVRNGSGIGRFGSIDSVSIRDRDPGLRIDGESVTSEYILCTYPTYPDTVLGRGSLAQGSQVA